MYLPYNNLAHDTVKFHYSVAQPNHNSLSTTCLILKNPICVRTFAPSYSILIPTRSHSARFHFLQQTYLINSHPPFNDLIIVQHTCAMAPYSSFSMVGINIAQISSYATIHTFYVVHIHAGIVTYRYVTHFISDTSPAFKPYPQCLYSTATSYTCVYCQIFCHF